MGGPGVAPAIEVTVTLIGMPDEPEVLKSLWAHGRAASWSPAFRPALAKISAGDDGDFVPAVPIDLAIPA